MSTTIPPKPDDAFRVLHTSDWHLGKLLNDRSREEEQRRFLHWLLDVVREASVQCIILAGDVFDTAYPSQAAQSLYFDFCSSLYRQGDCQFLVLAGNHDSAHHLEAPKQVLNALSTHVVGSLPAEPGERILFLPDRDQPRLAIAALPFLRDRDLRCGRAGESAEEIRDQITAGIRQRYRETAEALQAMRPPCPALATGHLTVLGSRTSRSERDIHIGGLGAVSADAFPELFRYVALGHLHRPQSVGGQRRVRYSGAPIPLSFSEASDVKQVRVLDVTSAGLVQHVLEVPVFRRLLQLRTSSAELDAALSELDPQNGELTTWVEVVVEDARLADDLNERVRQLTEGRALEVLRVLRGDLGAPGEMMAENATDDEAIDRLLDQPGFVFEHLLDQHPELGGADRDDLKLAFARLLELDAEPAGDAP